MKKFLMLPVSVGDSFILEKNDLRILVDGGSNRQKISEILSNHNINNFNIAVCTHADDDHINGIIGVLKNKCTQGDYCHKVYEVWLPAIWVFIIDSLSTQQNWKKSLSELDDYSSIEELADNLSSDILEEENESKGQQITKSEIDIAKHKLSSLENLIITLSMGKKHLKILKTLINTVNKIIELVEAALNRQCTIRWFKYSVTSPAKGGCRTLRPVNCYELHRIGSTIYNPFKVMALSRANRESLVFRSPCTGDNTKSDVVFSADSDFQFTQKKPDLIQEAIVTVAHHGSSEHSEFYVWLNSQIIKEPLLVRSDSKCIKRPCDEFLNIKLKTKAYCSICRLDKNTKQFTYKIARYFRDKTLGWEIKKPYPILTCECK